MKRGEGPARYCGFANCENSSPHTFWRLWGVGTKISDQVLLASGGLWESSRQWHTDLQEPKQ